MLKEDPLYSEMYYSLPRPAWMWAKQSPLLSLPAPGKRSFLEFQVLALHFTVGNAE